MRVLLFLCASAFADERTERMLQFVDSALELPPPVRERPKVKVRIEPAPGHPKYKLKAVK